jgi:hypothetical protein
MNETASEVPLPRSAAPAWRRRLLFPGLAVLLGLAHLAYVFHVEQPAAMFSSHPISGRDYDIHINQVWRVTEALDGFGRTWAWDPQVLAGFPVGTVFDADNKAWELWTWTLTKLGASKGLAFNLFVLLAHLLLPLVVYWSARLFDLSRLSALLACALAMSIWFFDGFVRWSWWEGMVAYSFAAYLCLPVLALFHRFLAHRRWRHAAALAAVLALAHLVHPWVFLVLVVPMGVTYALAFRSLRPFHHVAIAGAALLTLAANAWWLRVALEHWHYVISAKELGASYLGAGRIDHLLTDWLGLVSDRAVTGGAGMRSGLRFLVLGAAAIALVLWRKERDGRFWVFASAVPLLLAATYLGGYLPPLREVQPYRFIVPALFLAVVPAAALAGELARRRVLAGLPWFAWALGGILVLAILPRLARDVLYFTAALVPETAPLVEENPRITDTIGFGNIGYPAHKEFRHGPMPPDFVGVADWFRENDDGGGRVMVEHWTLGEMLAWKTKAQVLGGFRLRNLQHNAANFFRLYPLGEPPPGVLERYLDGYAVKWLVTSFTHQRFEARADLFEPVASIGTHRIFVSKRPVSFFAKNRGRVKAALNRLSVKATWPDEDVVLRYHWHEKLKCAPDCRVEREPLDGDPVGFIRVPAPHPEDFRIELRY